MMADRTTADQIRSMRALTAGMEILREEGLINDGDAVPMARLLRTSALRRGERPRVVLRVVDPARGDDQV